MSGILSSLIFLVLRVSGERGFPPPLKNEEEYRLFSEMKSGSRDARQKLIEHNLRLVAHIIKKYYNGGSSQEDLMSIGTIGLIKAVDTYNPDSGIRFATYGSKCLQNEILMYFRSQKKVSSEVSINEAIDIDKDGNPLTYIDVIACEDTIADDLDLKTRSAQIMYMVRNVLDERQKQIIIMRYGLDGTNPMTQREIATRLGISRSYVSRIEKSALETMKNNMG